MFILRRRSSMCNAKYQPCHQRAEVRLGFTIVELLVSVAIIGLLIAVTLPAVQQIRESGRAVECKNRQRQLILGVLNYAEVHSILPVMDGQYPACPLNCFKPEFKVGILGEKKSWATAIFPYLELQDMTDLVCSDVTSIPGLQCPSDPDVASFFFSMSYAANSGAPNSGYAFRSPFQHGTGLLQPMHLRDATDGMSQTVALSEIVTMVAGDTEEQANRRKHRNGWYVQLAPLPDPPTDEERQMQTEASLKSCAEGQYRSFLVNHQTAAATWIWSENTCYSHLYPVNSRVCAGLSSGRDSGFMTWIYRGASSMHPGGVHAAFLDGHCRFIADSIDTMVWRALGSQDGNEVVSDF